LGFREAHSYHLRRDTTNDGVKRHIFGDNCSGSHDCAVSDLHARQNDRARANPNVIPHDDITFAQSICVWRLVETYRTQWKGSYPVCSMLSEDKPDAIANATVLPDLDTIIGMVRDETFPL
jgi:hypothetical protein